MSRHVHFPEPGTLSMKARVSRAKCSRCRKPILFVPPAPEQAGYWRTYGRR